MSYQQIVVGIDLHDNYQVVVQQAIHLAQKYQASLDVVHVLPQVYTSVPYAYDFEAQLEEEAEKRLAEIKSEFTYDKLETHFLHGSPKHKLTEFALEKHADLIIVGSHGKHGVALLLGSTANGVVHGAKCDVLTVRIDHENYPAAAGDYNNIVLATDLRADNLKVIEQVKSLHAEFGGQCHAIHVIPDVASLASLYVPDIEDELASHAKDDIAKLTETLNVDKDDVKVVRGHPKEAILDYANSVKADLIVIGSHGRPMLEMAFVGSTAHAVLHGAEQDVLLVRI